ncbi:MAG TPA: CHASE3 domain-containing protein [Verrucomicrobiae bacterium]|jgi:CHASE3 domain sensor protein|nr:CHASE3 domain-containing protein [Verrucomicrobiae bacterium]
MKDNLEQRVVGLFVFMLAILAFVAASAVHTIQRSIKSEAWVNHTHDVIIHAGDVLSYLHAGDAALRTYVITGDRRDQASYRNAYNTMVERMDELKALTRSGEENADLHRRVFDLQDLVSNRIAIARSIAQTRGENGVEGVRTLLISNPDVESIGKIERYTASLIASEDGLLRQRDVEEHTQAIATKWTVYSGVAINFVLLAFVFGLLRDDLQARRKAAKALEEANAQLEIKVQERTAELVKTNQALAQENLERRWSYQSLEHQGRYNQLIINSIAEMVFVISRALNVSRVNPAVVQQTNWQPQELISQSIERVLQLPPDPAAGGDQNPLIQAMRDGREIQNRAATLLTRSGRTAAVRFSLIPLHDQDKVVGAVITARIHDDVPRPA